MEAEGTNEAFFFVSMENRTGESFHTPECWGRDWKLLNHTQSVALVCSSVAVCCCALTLVASLVYGICLAAGVGLSEIMDKQPFFGNTAADRFTFTPFLGFVTIAGSGTACAILFFITIAHGYVSQRTYSRMV